MSKKSLAVFVRRRPVQAKCDCVGELVCCVHALSITHLFGFAVTTHLRIYCVLFCSLP